MNKLSLTAAALLLASGCSKIDPAKAAEEHGHEAQHGKVTTMHDLPALEPAHPSSEPYKPTASEVPLTEDFAAAAEKRVTPDNYRAELITIEKELSQLKGN